MQKPPFKLAMSLTGPTGIGCCEHESGAEADQPGAVPHTNTHTQAHTRSRLAELDPHLHCSVIGTCLSTAELRKLMARFLFVRDSSDLEIHHEAVSHSSQGGPVTKALHKLLDQRHEAVVHRFAQAQQASALGELWQAALRQGEVPGAYWALLTHRHVTPDLRQQAFGDVHMLSHLVGSANRADIRRLVALERENGELRDRAERQQLRAQELVEERERVIAALERQLAAVRAAPSASSDALPVADEVSAALSQVALQTARRERAEQAAGVATTELARLRDELDHLAAHARTLGRELLAAETQLREIGDGVAAPGRALTAQLQGRRVFYVGGRPSSTPAIRDLVLRHGGEFQHHDGGLEDRKGLLAAGVAWAQLVVFPVDCVDHDSAGNLKRLCMRQGGAYLPLRGASVASFAAALAPSAGDDPARPPSPGCRA